MTSFETLRIEINNNIAVVTLNRPTALNALNQLMMSELNSFFNEELPQLSLVGVILTGEGEKAFVAGADITEFLSLEQMPDSELSKKGHAVFNSIENCAVPVIAAVNGFALGGGCELAMACHIRVASVNARFGTPEVNLGIIPGYGGTQRLVQLVGKGKALELMMTADMIGAEEAHRLGLVNHVVEHGKEVEKATEILQKIATKAPLAITKVIDSVNAFFDKNRNGYEAEINNFFDLSSTQDFKEGASAFVEKRKPQFSGK